MHNDCVSEYINVGAGVSGGFVNTNELRVMNYHEANGPDSELRKAELKKEHQRMVDSGVLKKVNRSELPSKKQIIDTTWATKKKSSGTLHGKVNAQGFKQVEGQHYDGSIISAPVTNITTIRMALTLMLSSGSIAHVVNTKEAFLFGKFDDGEKIYIKVPLRFKELFDNDTVLPLKKCLYGLKQASMAFYRKLFAVARNIGLKQSSADSCLYYKWDGDRLDIMISWINDNMIVDSTD
jgi:hypothetical protein